MHNTAHAVAVAASDGMPVSKRMMVLGRELQLKNMKWLKAGHLSYLTMQPQKAKITSPKIHVSFQAINARDSHK